MLVHVIEIEQPGHEKKWAVVSGMTVSGVFATDDAGGASRFPTAEDAEDAAEYVRGAPKFRRSMTATVRAVEVDEPLAVYRIAATGVQRPYAYVRLGKQGLTAGPAEEATRFAGFRTAERAGGLLMVARVQNVDRSVSKEPVLVRETAPAGT